MQLSSIDVIGSMLGPELADLRRMSSPDGAMTLMLCDIANAGELAQRVGEEPFMTLVSDHHVLVNQLVSHHDGAVVRTHRDGFMASFSSAHGALHCGIRLQRTFSAEAETAISLRLGLHSGFVIANPEQLLGRNVVLATRIATQAKGGEILVSEALKEYTEGDPRLRFDPRGEFHFKGMLGEHAVYALRWRELAGT